MKSSIIAMSVAAMLAFGVANAATTAAAPAPSKAQTAQQQKMSDCAKANKGKKGDDYKNSMSSCMKGSSAASPAAAAAPAAAAPAAAPAAAASPAKDKTAQQQKMSDCAKANKGKKGDDYKNSVSACMKK